MKLWHKSGWSNKWVLLRCTKMGQGMRPLSLRHECMNACLAANLYVCLYVFVCTCVRVCGCGCGCVRLYVQSLCKCAGVDVGLCVNVNVAVSVGEHKR